MALHRSLQRQYFNNVKTDAKNFAISSSAHVQCFVWRLIITLAKLKQYPITLINLINPQTHKPIVSGEC